MRPARLTVIMNKVNGHNNLVEELQPNANNEAEDSHENRFSELQSNERINNEREENHENNLLETATNAISEDYNKKEDNEGHSLDICKFQSATEKPVNKSPSSLSADSDYLAKATQDISRTPSTISNISFVLNQSDFIASPTVVFENRNFTETRVESYHDETIHATPSTSREIFSKNNKKHSSRRCLNYSSVSDNDHDGELDMNKTLTPEYDSDSILDNCTFLVPDADVTLTTTSNICQSSAYKNNEPSNCNIDDVINRSPSENVQPSETIAASTEDNGSRDSTTYKLKRLTRKRTRNEHERLDKKSKFLKNKGEAYIGCRSKKVFKKKTLKPKCKCQKKCGEKFSIEQREAIMQKYYELGDHERQWQFIANYTVAEDVKRITAIRKNNRTQTIRYYFLLETEKVQVCKVFFINTLNISHQTVYTALEKTNISCESSTDMRGCHDNRPHKMKVETAENIIQHINLFPTIESHYVRKDSNRQYLSELLNISKMYRLYKLWFENGTFNCPMASKRQYETIFNTKFNYSFFKPKKDQCAICTLYQQADPIKKGELEEKYERHQKNKQRVRQIKKDEKESIDPATSTIAIFDLEKVLSIPQSQVGIFHYKRKYPIYNFTVFDASRHKGYCYVWHYQLAKRGAVEIGSCLWQFLLSEKERGVQNVSFYSDGCGGQNKNRFIFAFYLYAAHTLKLNITHRFFETGHGQSEADSMHSRIEGELKNRVVYTPEQMYSIILNAKVNGEPYNVKEMTQNDFYDIKELITNKNWTKAQNGQKVSWSKVMEINVSHSSPSILRFKYDFDAEYLLINVEPNPRVMPRSKRNGRHASVSSSTEQSLKTAYTEPLPLSKALHGDLMGLCKSGAIPTYYHGFYNSLTSVDTLPDSNANEEDPEE